MDGIGSIDSNCVNAIKSHVSNTNPKCRVIFDASVSFVQKSDILVISWWSTHAAVAVADASTAAALTIRTGVKAFLCI